MPQDKIYSILKKYFGYDQFRPMQEDIIQTVMEKKDSLVLMPTGGGKSICYQIPAIALEGIAIVVSPLISLMKDQVEALKSNGVNAEFLNSSLSFNSQQNIENAAFNGRVKILYISPERLLSDNYLSFLKQLKINLFAIDEAHCISSWGHDFRPEYTQLNTLKEKFPDVPIIALTATADKITRKDILEQLNIPEAKSFVASFDRPNLSLNVVTARNRFAKIVDFLRIRPNTSGIIYCLSRKSTEETASKLQRLGYKAAHYHAGMESAERSKVQEEFVNDNIPIICATIAFGMGIDKSNVRWVIHYNLPKNIESYYQEIGRAGRDGLKSDTILFYSFGDVITLRSFAEQSGQPEIQMTKLQRIQEYADAKICRRKILLSYFGEHLEKDCGNCDVCHNPPAQFDGTIIAQKALSAIKRLDQKVPTGMLIDVLRGSGRREVFENGYHQIKTYGAGKDLSYFEWQQYLLQMLNLGLIEIAYDEGNAVKLTAASEAVLFKHRKVSLVEMAIMKTKPKEEAKQMTKKQMFDEGLFQKLRKLRKELAENENVPPYVVFSDATLTEMVEEKPVTEYAMRDITGVGDMKFWKYGETFINAILDYINEEFDKGTKVKGSTYLVTLEKFKKGLSIDEIAKERKLSTLTIVSHLAQLYEQGHDINILQFINENELAQIKEAIKAQPNAQGLKEIYEFLNEEIGYDKIRFGLAYWNKKMKIEN